MSDAAANPFSPEVVEAVRRHMNDDHGEDSLRIVRALGGQPEAESVAMVGMDGDGIDFSATVPGRGPVPVRVPWGRPITERAEVRQEVVRLHDEACARLGVAPGPGEGH